MHTPVLLQEVIESLEVKKEGLYIDATAGEGGHFKKILEKEGKVLAIDRDEKQIKNLYQEFKSQASKKLKLVTGNFADIEEIAKENSFYPVDGIIFDLGLSMKQIRESGKGFSFKNEDELLDMRLDKNTSVTAAELVNSLNADQIYEILATFSEELNSRAIAEAIVRTRSLRKIESVGDLLKVIDKVVGKRSKKVYSRVFQALRMAVNDELKNIKKGLKGAYDILKSGGRIAIITFHSIEDREVKRFIRENKLATINKKPITSENEKSFERSAKLRIIVKQ